MFKLRKTRQAQAIPPTKNLLSKCSSKLESSRTVTYYSNRQHRLEEEDRDEHAGAIASDDAVLDRWTFISVWRTEVERESQNDAPGNDALNYATPGFAEDASLIDDAYEVQA